MVMTIGLNCDPVSQSKIQNLKSKIQNVTYSTHAAFQPARDMMRVAFLGQPGSNSEEAALQYYGTALEAVHCDSFRAMCDALEQGHAEQALLPIENSVAGS